MAVKHNTRLNHQVWLCCQQPKHSSLKLLCRKLVTPITGFTGSSCAHWETGQPTALAAFFQLLYAQAPLCFCDLRLVLIPRSPPLRPYRATWAPPPSLLQTMLLCSNDDTMCNYIYVCTTVYSSTAGRPRHLRRLLTA